MRKFIYFVIFIIPLTQVLSQTKYRVEIKGQIFSQNNDVENVTIYNTSSNNGTITDESGEFKIMVALNDILEVSALQFKKGSIKITEEILNNMFMKISLIENVTELQEVVLLPYDLTGNLIVDAENVNLVAPIPFELGNMDHFQLPDDQYTEVINPFMTQGELLYGLNGMAILGFLVDAIFKSSKDSKSNSNKNENIILTRDLEGVLGRTFISDNFNIPEESVEAFIVFVENKGMDLNLLLDKNRMHLIEYLLEQSELFLKS